MTKDLLLSLLKSGLRIQLENSRAIHEDPFYVMSVIHRNGAVIACQSGEDWDILEVGMRRRLMAAGADRWAFMNVEIEE